MGPKFPFFSKKIRLIHSSAATDRQIGSSTSKWKQTPKKKGDATTHTHTQRSDLKEDTKDKEKIDEKKRTPARDRLSRVAVLRALSVVQEPLNRMKKKREIEREREREQETNAFPGGGGGEQLTATGGRTRTVPALPLSTPPLESVVRRRDLGQATKQQQQQQTKEQRRRIEDVPRHRKWRRRRRLSNASPKEASTKSTSTSSIGKRRKRTKQKSPSPSSSFTCRRRFFVCVCFFFCFWRIVRGVAAEFAADVRRPRPRPPPPGLRCGGSRWGAEWGAEWGGVAHRSSRQDRRT